MKNNKYKPRKKAFIGAIIGAATSIAGGIIGARKRKRAARREAARQKAIKRNEETYKSIEALNAGLEGQDNFMEQYMRYGGIAKNKKYKNRNKKAIGGVGEIIGSAISGAANIVSAVTESPEIAQTGNVIGQTIGKGLAKHNAKRIAEQRKDNLTKPIHINGINANSDLNLPTTLQPIKRYGGRKSVCRMACGGQKRK